MRWPSAQARWAQPSVGEALDHTIELTERQSFGLNDGAGAPAFL
jgi:hypothetical protein